MTKSIENLVRESGFTPGRSDFKKIIELLTTDSEKLAIAAQKSLVRGGVAVEKFLLESLATAKRPQRARLVETLSDLVSNLGKNDKEYRDLFLELTKDKDLKTSLIAIRALQDFPESAIENHVIDVAENSDRIEFSRAAVRTLGRIGGEKSLAWFQKFKNDKTFDQIIRDAERTIHRNLKKDSSSSIKSDAGSTKYRVHLTCREGLEELLLQSARKIGMSEIETSAGFVSGNFTSDLNEIYKLRLFDELSFPISKTFPSILDAVTSKESIDLISARTSGDFKFRLHAPKESRANLLQIVDAIKLKEPRLMNDPTKSTWEARITGENKNIKISWVPKQFQDPRFTYRKKDVPAASHPTIAAALAQVAGVREDDVVWDPFVGSGLELIERALLGKFRELIGTDLSDKAIAAAKANADAAKVKIKLIEIDCLKFNKVRPTLIMTNPPMGRRVQRGNMKLLMHEFIPHAAKLLASGGRMVWLSPLPDHSRKILMEMGLELTFAKMIDLGGFTAELQVFEKE